MKALKVAVAVAMLTAFATVASAGMMKTMTKPVCPTPIMKPMM